MNSEKKKFNAWLKRFEDLQQTTLSLDSLAFEAWQASRKVTLEEHLDLLAKLIANKLQEHFKHKDTKTDYDLGYMQALAEFEEILEKELGVDTK